jgi:hypothetical protein
MPARYPESVDYNEAVQNPESAFRDPELQRGRIEVNALGLPVALSGGFALTYLMQAASRKLAVRCFLRDIPAVQQKYAAIADAFRALKSRYFVDFEYLDDGIALHGAAFPVVKMDWAEGETFGVWLERNQNNRRALRRARDAFAALAAYLEQRGTGHGDIQTGNVIVSAAGLQLVDYDGVYVPGMPAEFGCECGHRHFQHPLRTTADFGPTVDRFSFIVVDLSLAALIEDSSLYPRFCRGGEAIILHAEDFADPAQSELLHTIEQCRGLAAPARNFAAVCRADIAAVPSLAEFRAGRNIPHTVAPKPAQAAPRLGSRNRDLVTRLLANGAAGQPRVAATRTPTASNGAILRKLRAAPPPGPAMTPTPVAAPPSQRAAPAPQRAAPPPPRSAPALIRPVAQPLPPSPPGSSERVRPRRRIPPKGSFVIHPRSRRPRPPPPASPPPPPTVWQRLLRFLGIT